MPLRALAHAILLGGGLALAPQGVAQTSLEQATQAVEDPSVLPAGEGQEEVFFACTACHSTAIIRRSRFTYERWDELMTWMTEVHGMNELEGEERRLIVTYLARHFGPAQVRPGARNPFLN